MILCVCGSPRGRASVSFALLEKLNVGKKTTVCLPLEKPPAGSEAKIPSGGEAKIPAGGEAKIPAGGAAVLSFPLYFDGLPSALLAALDDLPAECEYLYALVNCGFFEGAQTLPAFEILKDFCRKTGRYFSGGMGIGAGPLLRSPLSEKIHPQSSALRDLEVFSAAVAARKDFGVRLYSPRIPRRLYILCAHFSFRLRARRLRL